MTCIAWDGITLAADKYAYVNGITGITTKIRRVKNLLVGVSGNNVLTPQIFTWAETGFLDSAMPELQKDPRDHSAIMVITADREILLYENTTTPWVQERPFWAIGSGREFAIGAMAAKATAVEAIAIAADYAALCGRGCDTLTLE